MSANPPVITEGGGSYIALEGGGYIALEGGSVPTGPGIMPNLLGQLLWDALAILQQLGILVPASIGYFGTYPISVKWVTATDNRGVVVGQSIVAGVKVKPNTPILLTVNEYAVGVAFP